MKRYRLDRDARADLVSIHTYIARDNSTAADRLINELKQGKGGRTIFRLQSHE